VTAVLAPWAALAAEHPLSVELRAQASVDDITIDLGQLLTVAGGDEALRQRLQELRLSLSALPGQSERVTREDVESLLALRMPEIAGQLSWSGATRFCLVRMVGHPLDPETLTDRAQNELAVWLHNRYADFRIKAVRPSQEQALQVGSGQQAVVRPFAGPIGSRAAVWIDLLGKDGRSNGAFPIWFEVEARKEVAVAARAIPSGSRIGSDQLKTVTADVAALGARPLMPADDVSRSITIGPIAEGQVLTEDLFRRVPPVVAGDEVRMQVERGALHIEARGVALESGESGQKVRVRNSGSGEVLVAYVAGPGLVDVSP